MGSEPYHQGFDVSLVYNKFPVGTLSWKSMEWIHELLESRDPLRWLSKGRTLPRRVVRWFVEKCFSGAECGATTGNMLYLAGHEGGPIALWKRQRMPNSGISSQAHSRWRRWVFNCEMNRPIWYQSSCPSLTCILTGKFLLQLNVFLPNLVLLDQISVYHVIAIVCI